MKTRTEMLRLWRERNRDKVNLQSRAYAARNPDKRRETLADYRTRNRDKIRARKEVEKAIRRGDLVPQPCESCGAEPAGAHHDDYSKPLEVRWLCDPCHGKQHRHE